MRKQWGRLLGAMLGLILVIGAGLEAHSQGGAPAPMPGGTKSAAKADQPKTGSASRNPGGSEPIGAAKDQTKSENSAGAVSQASQPESHVATPTVQSNPSWWELRPDLPLWLRILFYLWLALVCIFVLWGLWVVGSWIWSIERRFTELSAGLLKANNELKNLGDIAVQAQESAGQAGHGASNALSQLARLQSDLARPTSGESPAPPTVDDMTASYNKSLGGAGGEQHMDLLKTHSALAVVLNDRRPGRVSFRSAGEGSGSSDFVVIRVEGQALLYPGIKHYRDAPSLITANWSQAKSRFGGIFELRERANIVFSVQRPAKLREAKGQFEIAAVGAIDLPLAG